MQEEVENRTVNLVIVSSKMTARTLAEAAKRIRARRRNSSINRKAKRTASKEKSPTGKQTVKQLIAQNQGAKSIDISETDIKGFERYARKYGVDYAIKKDSTQKPPKYLLYFKARDTDVLENALKEYAAAALGVKKTRPSVLKQLERYKELAKTIPRKAREKVQEIRR